jgi:hypothetical protein
VHVDLQRLDGRGRRILSPEAVDQLLRRDDAPAIDEQEREQRALLRRAERHEPAVGHGLYRLQDAELRSQTLAP